MDAHKRSAVGLPGSKGPSAKAVAHLTVLDIKLHIHIQTTICDRPPFQDVKTSWGCSVEVPLELGLRGDPRLQHHPWHNNAVPSYQLLSNIEPGAASRLSRWTINGHAIRSTRRARFSRDCVGHTRLLARESVPSSGTKKGCCASGSGAQRPTCQIADPCTGSEKAVELSG